MFIVLVICYIMSNIPIMDAYTDNIHLHVNCIWNYNDIIKITMNINSPQEAYTFLISNGLVGICPEAQSLVACVDVLSRMCACDPAEAKQKRYGQCVQCYMGFISKAPSLSGILFKKINDGRLSFYINNQIISTIVR